MLIKLFLVLEDSPSCIASSGGILLQKSSFDLTRWGRKDYGRSTRLLVRRKCRG